MQNKIWFTLIKFFVTYTLVLTWFVKSEVFAIDCMSRNMVYIFQRTTFTYNMLQVSWTTHPYTCSVDIFCNESAKLQFVWYCVIETENITKYSTV